MEEKSITEILIENSKYFKDKDGALDKEAYHKYLVKKFVDMCNFAMKATGMSKKELLKMIKLWEKQEDPKA